VTRSVGLWPGRVRAAYAEVLGDDVALDSADDTFGAVQVDVVPDRWVDALLLARDGLGCTFFDFLTAVDRLAEGFHVVCHVAAHRPGGVEHLLVRTAVPREAAVLATAVQVFAGASWHERETHEMFGIDFARDGAPMPLAPLLLPDEFEGHPLRKEFVLASRVAKPWPGAKEPGESDHAPAATTSRRRARPPGVPTPEEWGPRDA
jgi:NADH-quinone oxidoreductase subunit C